MSFNINSKAFSDTTILQLRDPVSDELLFADTEETQPLTIEIFGKSSKQYRSALSALSRKSMARKNKPQSFETNVEDNADILVAISKKASNFDMDGKAIDSPEAFKELYSNPSLYWIRDMVQNALEENENFLQK